MVEGNRKESQSEINHSQNTLKDLFVQHKYCRASIDLWDVEKGTEGRD